jgi:hypothetical protein
LWKMTSNGLLMQIHDWRKEESLCFAFQQWDKSDISICFCCWQVSRKYFESIIKANDWDFKERNILNKFWTFEKSTISNSYPTLSNRNSILQSITTLVEDRLLSILSFLDGSS